MRRRLFKRNIGTKEVRGIVKQVLKNSRAGSSGNRKTGSQNNRVLTCSYILYHGRREVIPVQSRIPPQIKGFRGSIMDDTEMISFNLLEKDQFL